MTMDESAIDRIAELALQGARPVELSGLTYSPQELHLPPPEPLPEALSLSTLSSLVDYLRRVRAGSEEVACVQVCSPTQVRVLGHLEGRHNRRAVRAIAEYRGPDACLGKFLPMEAATILLASAFQPTALRDALRGTLSAVTVGSDVRVADDGLSQSVEVRQGVVRVGNATIPNPIVLAPFAMFPEVGNQPERPFLIRLRHVKDGLPEVALFECDGGAWRIEAVQRVADHLKDRLADTVPVLS